MKAVVQLFQQQRPLNLETFFGLIMIVKGLIFLAFPMSIAVAWINAIFGIHLTLQPLGVTLLIFGYWTALSSETSTVWFVAHTFPTLAFGLIQLVYGFNANGASLNVGLSIVGMYIAIVLAQSIIERYRRWIRQQSSERSA
jgi:hypothetical protein